MVTRFGASAPSSATIFPPRAKNVPPADLIASVTFGRYAACASGLMTSISETICQGTARATDGVLHLADRKHHAAQLRNIITSEKFTERNGPPFFLSLWEVPMTSQATEGACAFAWRNYLLLHTGISENDSRRAALSRATSPIFVIPANMISISCK